MVEVVDELKAKLAEIDGLSFVTIACQNWVLMSTVRVTELQMTSFNMTVLEHAPTGWLVATSDQLPELLVQGKDLDQIRERATNVVRRILERKGRVVDVVKIEPPAPETPAHFVTRELVAVALMLRGCLEVHVNFVG